MTYLLRFFPVALTCLVAAVSCAVGEADSASEGSENRVDAIATSIEPAPTATIILPPIVKFCLSSDACQVGTWNSATSACVYGPRNCDDGNPCTNDSCDSTAGCQYTDAASTTRCSDGNPCTNDDHCSAGACVGGGDLNCDDNNPCTDDSCDPTLVCVHSNLEAGTTCSDGNGCTTPDTCDGEGKCAGPGKSCDDGNPCTTNGCSANTCALSPEPEGTPCVPVNKCLVNAACNDSGLCAGGVPKDCDDNNPCTADGCNPETGECKSTPDDGTECSDGSACTVNDHCEDGTCTGEDVACLAIDECHADGECDLETGLCSTPTSENGIECGEGQGTCQDGACARTPGAGGAGNEPTAGASGEGGAESETPDSNASGAGGEGNQGPNNTGDADPARGGIFKREGGGCSISAGANNSSGFAVLALLGAAALAARRARASREEPKRMNAK